MCKNFNLQIVEEPKPKPGRFHRKSRVSDGIVSTFQSGIYHFFNASTINGNSIASLREIVFPDNPILYRLKEITESTGQFSRGRIGKSSVWKSNLRGQTVAITIRRVKKIRDFIPGIRKFCSAHHANIIKFMGGCCEGEHMYLVYDYVQGSSLADCLRNSRMPAFTVLKTWISRMQIAIDVARALEYMHHDTNMKYVHSYVKSSSIMITEPAYRARICHVGASYLAGEYDFGDTHEDFETSKDKARCGEITEEGEEGSLKGMKWPKRCNSMKIRGTQGYMAPEYVSAGVVSQKTDVFAFGVILLELLSGHEPVRYVTKGNKEVEKVSLIECVNRIVCDDVGGECKGRVRSWIDPRLKDSFPVDCAERVARLAASCVDSDPHRRPDMRYVAWQLSKVYIRSQQWSQKMQGKKELITVTFEAR